MWNMSRGKVFSFSVFDAVLTKRTATSAGLFCALQHQLRSRHDLAVPLQFIEEFFEVRVSADACAREASDEEEILLDEIYAQIGLRFPEIPAAVIESIKQAELEVENELLFGVPETIRRIHRLLDEGERVVLVCDTYLPEKTLRRLLTEVDSRLRECPLYVSSTIRKSMASGGLFLHLLRSEGIKPKQLAHCGSNIHTDIKTARSLGIRGSLYQATWLSEIEVRYFEEDNLFAQLLAGVSRSFRLMHPDASNPALIGACLAGPMFYGFILDVLRQARERGISKLYFIARDGMVFLRIARAIAQVNPMGLDLRYLYGSRRAFRLPSVFEITPREKRWLAERIPALSLSMLAERLDMTGDALRAFLPEPMQARFNDLDTSMSEDLAMEVVELLDEIPPLRDRILQNAARDRDEIIAYLRQEGFFDDPRVATVDIGWMGGSQDSLYKIAASHKRDIEIHGFYFGLFHYSKYTTRRNSKTAYAILPNHTTNNIVALHTELLAQADHGQTIGYQRLANGTTVPRLRDDGDHLHDWGVSDFLAGVEWFSSEYARTAEHYPLAPQHFLAVVPTLFSLMMKPTPLIAETLGAVPYSGDHCDLKLRESAPAFSVRQALSYAFSQRYENRRLMTEWYEATLVRSSPLARAILKLHPFVQGSKYVIKHSLLLIINKIKNIHASGRRWTRQRSAGSAKRVSPVKREMPEIR
jgi:predicted HAD superfamily hydrolase